MPTNQYQEIGERTERSCWYTFATVVFRMITLTSFILNILIIEGVIVIVAPEGNIVTRGLHGIQGIAGPTGPPGPPGSPGIRASGANFSLCQYKQVESTPVTSNSLAETDVILKVPEGKKFFGVTCSTNAALEYNLIAMTDRTGKRVYRCVCKGQSMKFVSGSGQMYCYLHYWECPLG